MHVSAAFVLFSTLLLPLSAQARPGVDVERRAADMLEELRGRENSDWAAARLRPDPVPLYRPGESAPLYLEFSVEGPDGAPRGFMVLSTTEDDAPLVHAALEGRAPTEILREQAGARTPARFYRLGQTYVAEDARGRLVARVGDLPGKLVGYDPAWLDAPASARAGSARWSAAAGYKETIPEPGLGMNIEHWGTWAKIRREYETNRAPLHERDRRAAADDWENERALRDNGETLQSGEFRELPLLDRGAPTFRVSGSGAQYVHVVEAERFVEGDSALRAFVTGVPRHGIYEVDIDVDYADGSSETLRLNVTDKIPNDVLGAAASADPGVIAVPGINCKKTAFKTALGNFVNRRGTAIEAKANYHWQAEMFHVTHLGGGRVTLKASNGKWLEAIGRGGAAISATAIGPTRPATFRFFKNRHASDWYGFQTDDRSHYIVPASNGNIDATHTTDDWSRFKLEYCEPVRIKSHWGGSSLDRVWSMARKYDQLPPKKAPSDSQCASGCGATAWAMLFGFHDKQASLGGAKWKRFKGLYRANGSVAGDANAVAPAWMWTGFAGRPGMFVPKNDPAVRPNAGVASMIWEISRKMNDWVLAGCGPGGQKWTAPVIMGRAHKYLDGRVTGLKLISDYDGAMIFTHEGKVKAMKVIADLKQPIVIGIRDPEHYPLALGWEATRYKVWDRGQHRWKPEAQREHFVVHMGHQQNHTDLVPYDSWFQGSLSVPANAVNGVETAAPKTDDKGSSKSKKGAPKSKKRNRTRDFRRKRRR